MASNAKAWTATGTMGTLSRQWNGASESRERTTYSNQPCGNSWLAGHLWGKTLRSLPQTTHTETFQMNQRFENFKYHKQLENNIRPPFQNFAVGKARISKGKE